jgi:putative transposase
MEHQGYARNAGAVFSLKYHLVFCPKYRKSILVGPVAERLKVLLATKADELHVTLHILEVRLDYVQVCVGSDPGIAPVKLAA